MKAARILIIGFVLLGVLVTRVEAQKYSTVKITPPQDKQERAALLGLLEIDHFNFHEGSILAEISQDQLATLRQSRYQYEVVVADVARNLHEINERYFSASPTARVAMEQPGGTIGNLIPTPTAFQVHGTLGGFYSFAQMNTAMNNLVATYPNLAQKISLGQSIEGRDIWCIKISDSVASDSPYEPEVLFLGLQHAREAIGGSSLIFLMQYLCQNYATDTRIRDLVNNREIFIIPCMNPDGWEYNRMDEPNGGGGWRKNRRNNGNGTFGVDLNRNWGVDFGNCSGASSSCGSGTSSSDVYWGSHAFSEPETQAVRDFVLSHHIVSMIDQHAFGPYYSLPFGRPSLHTGLDSLNEMDQDYFHHVPASMGKYNGMRAGNSIQSVGYEVAGGVKDWMLKGDIGVGTKAKIWGMTGEGGAGGGTGGSYGSFWPPASEIINLCKGMVFQDLQMIFAAGSYADITDQSDIALTATTGSVNYKVQRIGIQDGPVIVTLVPLENIYVANPSDTINSLPGYYDVHNGTIGYELPGGIQAGHRIRYAWRVQTGGQTYYDTIVKFFNPVEMFYDNMEGSDVEDNWSTGVGNWNYSTAMSYQGTKSLTESPAGLYGQNRRDTIWCNQVLNLSNATAAYISFRVRHRAENFRDKLQLQVSQNGSTWTAVAGRTTVQEPGTLDGSTINGQPALTGIQGDWIPELYNLSAYLGQPNVRFRFVFTSDANTTGFDFQVDQGFNIDNLKVIKSTIALVTLPVKFISLSGFQKPDNSIQLNWEAVTDQDHDHFVIERSADGVSFTAIGTQPALPFTFNDAHPYTGINYYRIKAVSRNGESAYSKTIHIVYKPNWNITVYPNPVADELNIRIRTFSTEFVSMMITDMTGKILYTRELNAGIVSNDIQVSTEAWPSGIYMMRMTNSRNETIATRQLVKQ